MQMSTLRFTAILAAAIGLAATPPSTSPKLTDRQIADFWRAKSALTEAQAACSSQPNWTAAKSDLDKSIAGMRATCGHDPVFGPDGHPSCGPDVPAAPAAKAVPDGK